ncbi:GNAT family N-acetyltransferase [Ovoidimarina sediminis]|uniref:GNAT family N-acetyltransferase n=1 Tax=Ovoidimarina sediminis TaxID=3079856 RepID=UPI0029118DAC|nr:GNAT family N-acetyltransferase [Rhodophyticola sp. MJ-SS7]MDU8943477.1 GNAT family N-acetyltransferase [Rhodophyticola sp. MJ-SS7]
MLLNSEGELPIRAVEAHEADRFAATLALAMSSDPPVRWGAPDARNYLDMWLALIPAFAGSNSIALGCAHVVGDFLGATCWLPPGEKPNDDAGWTVLTKHCDNTRLERVAAVFEEMGKHHPSEPHWYLWLIGVDPAFHGHGLGSKLMERGIAASNSDGAPCYLEATTQKVVPLYERFGFEVIDEIIVHDCPPLYPMVRYSKLGEV